MPCTPSGRCPASAWRPSIGVATMSLQRGASILFDAAACHYLTTDGLAVLGSQLVSKLVKAPRGKYDM